MSDENRTKRSKPLHRIIFEHIKKLILSEEFDLCRKLPADNQLMHESGVSGATMVKAMHDLENQSLIERQPGVGSFVPICASIA